MLFLQHLSHSCHLGIQRTVQYPAGGLKRVLSILRESGDCCQLVTDGLRLCCREDSVVSQYLGALFAGHELHILPCQIRHIGLCIDGNRCGGTNRSACLCISRVRNGGHAPVKVKLARVLILCQGSDEP